MKGDDACRRHSVRMYPDLPAQSKTLPLSGWWKTQMDLAIRAGFNKSTSRNAPTTNFYHSVQRTSPTHLVFSNRSLPSSHVRPLQLGQRGPRGGEIIASQTLLVMPALPVAHLYGRCMSITTSIRGRGRAATSRRKRSGHDS